MSTVGCTVHHSLKPQHSSKRDSSSSWPEGCRGGGKRGRGRNGVSCVSTGERGVHHPLKALLQAALLKARLEQLFGTRGEEGGGGAENGQRGKAWSGAVFPFQVH